MLSGKRSKEQRQLQTRRRRRAALTAALATAAVATVGVLVAGAAPGTTYVSGVTFPFNGVWLDSVDGGHYWDASGSGLCRIDRNPDTGQFSENAATCNVEAKKPTQAVVDPTDMALAMATLPAPTTYSVFAADMSSKSGGPVRLTFDPTADGGKGAIVAGSGQLLGGLNTVGFFADSAGNFKNSSVALGPCDQTAASPPAPGCRALYVGFERSQKIERIDNVLAPNTADETIETISKTTDKRKGVRFGMGVFHKPDGTDDLYIDELGGNGVSMISDVARCTPSQTATTNNALGGCAATVVGGITTNFPQGMAVQNTNPDGSGDGRFIYVADSPRNASATVLRYDPSTGFQDVVSSTVDPPYDSLLNPGTTVSTYTFVLGLAVNPHNGDLFIGDDPTFAVLVNPPPAKGHVFTIAGDPATHAAPADCVGSATVSCTPPPPPSVVTPQLYAYGLTAPKGGMTFVPSDDGGHFWAADHSQGLCRMDVVSQAPGLHAYNSDHCDDGALLGSGGQTVYDPDTLPAPTGSLQHLHYLYVAQNDHLSPGVIRFTFDPSADGGHGDLVPGSGVVMAPNAGLGGDKANGLALGPCATDAGGALRFPTCKHALYMGGLLDGFIRRINNPQDDPRSQSVDVVAQTTEQRAGVAGRGINGSMGMIGDDLYLPENQGFTVVRSISKCGTTSTSTPCSTTPLNIGQFGFIFGSAIGVDDNPAHSSKGLVYAAISPGAANATLYQYDVATNTARIYATKGQMPPAGSAEATVFCTLTCTRPADPANPPGGTGNFRFAQGVVTDSDGNVYITEDAFAGARGGRGHAWWMPFIDYPSGVTPVPLPPPDSTPAAASTCTVNLNVPKLNNGQTWWVQFTAHAAGVLKTTWSNSGSAQLALYPGNPFSGLSDPVSTGTKGGSLQTVKQAPFSITTTSQPAGTYTAQFFSQVNQTAATTATLTYNNDATTGCPTVAPADHIIG